MASNGRWTGAALLVQARKLLPCSTLLCLLCTFMDELSLALSLPSMSSFWTSGDMVTHH